MSYLYNRIKYISAFTFLFVEARINKLIFLALFCVSSRHINKSHVATCWLYGWVCRQSLVTGALT